VAGRSVRTNAVSATVLVGSVVCLPEYSMPH
jgi:hypothetical protein